MEAETILLDVCSPYLMIRLHANTNMLPSNFKQLYSATIVVCVVVLGTIVMYCCVDVYCIHTLRTIVTM